MTAVIAFTGPAIINGQPRDRYEVEIMARRRGFMVRRRDIREGDAFLVTLMPNAATWKARKARQLNIPVITPDEFAALPALERGENNEADQTQS